jgi:hypothetical protein
LDGIAERPEHERERINVPPAHFADAQAEQALWQEFHDHGASLNRALNEALRIRVCDLSPGFVVFLISFLSRLRFL